jgi:hypothetical protein
MSRSRRRSSNWNMKRKIKRNMLKKYVKEQKKGKKR